MRLTGQGPLNQHCIAQILSAANRATLTHCSHCHAMHLLVLHMHVCTCNHNAPRVLFINPCSLLCTHCIAVLLSTPAGPSGAGSSGRAADTQAGPDRAAGQVRRSTERGGISSRCTTHSRELGRGRRGEVAKQRCDSERLVVKVCNWLGVVRESCFNEADR